MSLGEEERRSMVALEIESNVTPDELLGRIEPAKKMIDTIAAMVKE